MESNIREGVLFRDPTTNAEREQVANSCVRKLHLQIPALIDSIDNKVEQQYTGWPDRLYVVGTDGRIAFKTEPGPFGFDANKLASALAAITAREPRRESAELTRRYTSSGTTNGAR